MSNFAKEFRLYESLFSESVNQMNDETTVQLTEGFLASVKSVLSKIGDKLDDVTIKTVTKQVVKNMEVAEEPEEADLDDTENIMIYTTKDNGKYIIKKENESLVKKVDTLMDAIYNCDDTFAGYEIFTYLLSVLKVPFQFYFED